MVYLRIARLKPGLTPLPRRRRVFGPIFLALGVLAGCAYQGAIDQPATIKATWFSYLNGDDIRSACTDGAPSWYRLVYNGNYSEQLRTYEVVADGTGGAYYKARVQTGSGLDLTRFSFGDPQAMAGWTTAQTRLVPADLAALERALEASGAFGPAPVGLRLASEQFYWVASLCRDGRFHFNAWLYPWSRAAGLRFPQVLLGHDGTGIAINPPRAVAPIERVRRTIKGEGGPRHFDLEVGENGFKGHQTIF